MKRRILATVVLMCFILSTVFSLRLMDSNGTGPKTAAGKLAMLCVAQTYPILEHDLSEDKGTANKETETSDAITTDVKTVKKQEKEAKDKTKVDNTKPQVIIYHTHSSESYQPYTASNFHRQEEAGTVREVGNVMTKELNELGISVVHDKTIHDSPSYNESYDRSMETITSLLEKYPTAEVVIDLHRDAAAYTGNVGETIEIEGNRVAKYKLVVGQSNDNYGLLMDFASRVNAVAESLYPGFSGRIIEKEYRYNEYVADKYLLLEVGNNQNDIKEVRQTGKYFAHVLAKVLEE